MKTEKRTAKLPKARVEQHRNPDATRKRDAYRNNAVLPCHTAAQARALARWHNMPTEKKVEIIALEIACHDLGKSRVRWASNIGRYRGVARAVIAALEGKQ